MTAFKLALAHVGLTQSEAAVHLGVSIKSVEAWSRGRTQGDWTAQPPPEVWERLRALAMRQRQAAKSQNDKDPWPSPGAEAMPAILKWIATGKAPTAEKLRRRKQSGETAITFPDREK